MAKLVPSTHHVGEPKIQAQRRGPIFPPPRPQVASAICTQVQTLNTNSRYLSQGLVDFSKQLLDLLPDNLEVRCWGLLRISVIDSSHAYPD